MSNEGPSNLAEALQQEIIRVRDRVMPTYIQIGMSGTFALAGMRADLNRATKALAEGDAIECLRVFKSLQEWHT